MVSRYKHRTHTHTPEVLAPPLSFSLYFSLGADGVDLSQSSLIQGQSHTPIPFPYQPRASVDTQEHWRVLDEAQHIPFQHWNERAIVAWVATGLGMSLSLFSPSLPLSLSPLLSSLLSPSLLSPLPLSPPLSLSPFSLSPSLSLSPSPSLPLHFVFGWELYMNITTWTATGIHVLCVAVTVCGGGSHV